MTDFPTVIHPKRYNDMLVYRNLIDNLLLMQNDSYASNTRQSPHIRL
nr:MAG TPA: hypothetical protein [Caudoviricetes sp.]